MKKRIITAAVLALALCGCMNSTAKKAMEEAKLSAAAGDYTAALNYGNLSLREGCNNPEFIALVNCLTAYDNAKKALESGDVDSAASELSAASGNDDGTMTAAISELSQSVEERRAEIDEDNTALDSVEERISKGYLATARSDLREIDSSRLTETQKQRFDELEAQSAEPEESKTTPTPRPSSGSENRSYKAYISAEDAEKAVRQEMSIDNDAEFEIIDKGEYYQVNVTQYFTDTDGSTIVDGVACKVDKKTGEIYDQAG